MDKYVIIALPLTIPKLKGDAIIEKAFTDSDVRDPFNSYHLFLLQCFTYILSVSVRQINEI